MVEPLTTTGLVIASGLLGRACNLLGVTADLHGLGATHLIKSLTQRFDSAPDDTHVFFRATWRAAVQATHGCVQQVFDHTDVSDDVRGDLRTWNRYRDAHLRVRKVRGWGDAAELPQMLERALTQSLPQALQVRADANASADSMELMWTCYCEALRAAGFDGEPPAVIRQAFFGERSEAKVWPWSKHFALRIGEQLRGNARFKAMFDAEQFAGIRAGIERLIQEFASVEQVMAALLAKLDDFQQTAERTEQTAERTEQKVINIQEEQQRFHDDFNAKFDLIIEPMLRENAALSQEVKRLRQRPDIRVEDLAGWLLGIVDSSESLLPEKLPELLQKALTVDLPKLRDEAQSYQLDSLASLEAQSLLEEVRALLRPQAGTPLDLKAAREKLKVLDDRIVAERAERRQREDRELAELRVLRSDAERVSANYAAAAELMEQVAGLCHDVVKARALNEQAAQDWYKHSEIHPGLDALYAAIRLLRALILPMDQGEECARLNNKLGNTEAKLGERLGGEAGLQAFWAAVASYGTALEVRTRQSMPLDWAATQNNLGAVQSSLGERLDGAAGLQALRAAEKSYHAALEVRTRETMPKEWATTKNNLGTVQRSLGERLGGEAGLQALRAAEESYRAALEVYTRETAPVTWATIKNNLGTVQSSLSEQLDGEVGLQKLHAAEASHRAALDVFARDTMPLAWAMTQNNLGIVQSSLSERLDGEARLQALWAVEASYRATLKVYTRETMPVDWAMAQINLAVVQFSLGECLEGDEALQALRTAEASYRVVLEVHMRNTMPVVWAMTQNNLGTVQRSLGERLGGDAGLQAFRNAEASYRAALDVLTHDAMPAYWRIVAKNLAIVEKLIAERGG